MDAPSFDRQFAQVAGTVAQVSARVRRLLAPNPGPFTFTGTCSYIVGERVVAVIDPGPDDPAHLAALLAALRGVTVSHIVITHTHRDHTGAVKALQAQTGALVVGAGHHRAARALALGEANPLDASSDGAYRPDTELGDGDAVTGPDWTLEAVATPGHTANHVCFALPEEEALFSGDHVMAWSTSIVAPPDGAMGDYLASLERLKGRAARCFWPGHGGPVTDPGRFVRGLITHRRMREASILNRLREGDRRIAEIVPKVYEGLAPALFGAAALSTFAHIEHLVAQGLVRALDGPPRLDGVFEAAPAGSAA